MDDTNGQTAPVPPRSIAAIVTQGERPHAREWMQIREDGGGAAECAEIGAIITRGDLATEVAARMPRAARGARVTAAEIDLAMAQGAYAVAALSRLVVETLATQLVAFAEQDAPREVCDRWRALGTRFARALAATAHHAPELVPGGDEAAAAIAERDIGSRMLNALVAGSEPPRHNDYTGLARVVALNAAAQFLLRDGGPELLEGLAAAARAQMDERGDE